MKTIGTALQAHLGGELTCLARLVKISRVDGVVLGLTDHDADLTFGGILYHAESSFTAEKFAQKATLESADTKVVGILDSAYLDKDDLLAGRYDHARIDIYICNWQDLSQGIVQIKCGWLGEVSLKDDSYQAVFCGLRDLLTRRVGQVYTPECRHDFCDAKCGLSVAAFQVAGSVTSVSSDLVFSDTGRTEETDVFAYGRITWTSGANIGVSVEIATWDAVAKTFTLWVPLSSAIQIGDTYLATMGCNKRFSVCRDRFANVARFGGFPHMAGLAKILQYPDNS